MLRILFFMPWLALMVGATYWVIEVPGWASFLGLFVAATCLAISAIGYAAIRAARGVFQSFENNKWIKLLVGKSEAFGSLSVLKPPQPAEWGEDFDLIDQLYRRASETKGDQQNRLVWVACYHAMAELHARERAIRARIEQRFARTELSFERFQSVVSKTSELIRFEVRSRLNSSTRNWNSIAERENWAVVQESLKKLNELDLSLETSDPQRSANRKNLEQQMQELENLSARVKKFGDQGL